jgi:hypothetical protein
MEGGCLCGAIRFHAIGQPIDANYCHCSQCRRHTGAPVAAFAGFPIAHLVWSKGQPRVFASSAKAHRSFCPDCGTSLTWQDLAEPDRIYLYVGAFNDPSSLYPRDHVWSENAIPWLRIEDSLPRHKRTRREG